MYINGGNLLALLVSCNERGRVRRQNIRGGSRKGQPILTARTFQLEFWGRQCFIAEEVLAGRGCQH